MYEPVAKRWNLEEAIARMLQKVVSLENRCKSHFSVPASQHTKIIPKTSLKLKEGKGVEGEGVSLPLTKSLDEEGKTELDKTVSLPAFNSLLPP